MTTDRQQTADRHPIAGDRVTASDFRRAAALLAHHAANDRVGVAAVIDEAEAAGHLRQLAHTLPAVIAGLSGPEWHAGSTVAHLRGAVAVFVAREGEEGR